MPSAAIVSRFSTPVQTRAIELCHDLILTRHISRCVMAMSTFATEDCSVAPFCVAGSSVFCT